MGYLSSLVIQAAGAWWILPAVFVFCLVDGFLPVLPNATLIVALASLSETSGDPNLLLLGATGAAGVIAGDNIAYRIGAHFGAHHEEWSGPGGALKRARFALDRRGAALVFAGRYLPGGRTAVNLTAGATKYPPEKFIWLDAAAALTWAGYCIGVGVAAGKWAHQHPLPAAAVAIALSLTIGAITDHLLQRRPHRATPTIRRDARDPGDTRDTP